ncbi:hypothetical protein LCGC14_2156630 [marine sediment metagenome]|uniref:SpoVT-AbrB domain-containing protein n=1 Tax=marine sediment metagenome TaxID=412755 RepID=A0A0F9DU62_9ZZZZ
MVREVKKGFKIIKIGNSQGVIIEKKTLDYLGLKAGDWVELIIKKAEKEERNNKD